MLQKAINGWCRRSNVSKNELARRMQVDRAILAEKNERRLLRSEWAMAALHRETGIPYETACADIIRAWEREEKRNAAR